MISIISGKIKLKASNFVIIDVGGIGYKVFATRDVLNKLSPEEEVELFTHLHLRENGLELYGFLKYEELEFFELLISISGIGPKMAQGILSLAPVSRIKQAILDQDSSLLTKVSGIGKKNAQRIIDMTKKMENFVNRQLELADAGKTIGELEEIDLNKMIDEVGKAHNIEIHRGDLPMIKGDQQRLKEVFHNLINNAIKHGEADKIEIFSEKKENIYVIYVRDNGKGIPKEDIDKIFDMGYSKTGTGFGLSIVRKIIGTHNGSISVESKEEEGTTFEIVLPIRT